MHGLGPHNITVGGRATTVRQEMKELYSAIEEAKADISGLWALRQLADRKLIDPGITKTMYTTFLASAFRSIRFGINEAHGRGIAVQLNYLLDAGAFKVLPGGTFAVDEAKVADAVTALTRDIMTLEAEGNYAKAKDLLDRLGIVRPPVQKVLDRLTSVPVDIEPNFTSAQTRFYRVLRFWGSTRFVQVLRFCSFDTPQNPVNQKNLIEPSNLVEPSRT